ncbi:MAG: shikimate dehydrogenase [Flavobacteriaceae bacterium]|nr:shikimate dehydrogenase [Flavobacteriaceae bacterium]|tara:strand:- start:7889 stop:8629 length:741 start_codon:yes stop_codon:yes gene_type:complete
MEKKEVKKIGLIGKNIKYSFSKKYFEEKFIHNHVDNFVYENFDIKSLSDLNLILKKRNLVGLNVTIPYKEKIIPYLDELSKNAKLIGAVNTIYFKDQKIIGDNTDIIGFEIALKSFIKSEKPKAMILGTGGASKAVNFVLKKNNIDLIVVSRNPKKDEINYDDIDEDLIISNPLIINCTPLGTYPSIYKCPRIPYKLLNTKNYLFDLVYNPEVTLFMKKGIEKGAKVTNGYKMLKEQAEASWEYWK